MNVFKPGSSCANKTTESAKERLLLARPKMKMKPHLDEVLRHTQHCVETGVDSVKCRLQHHGHRAEHTVCSGKCVLSLVDALLTRKLLQLTRLTEKLEGNSPLLAG